MTPLKYRKHSHNDIEFGAMQPSMFMDEAEGMRSGDSSPHWPCQSMNDQLLIENWLIK